jgi:hypothetical protein
MRTSCARLPLCLIFLLLPITASAEIFHVAAPVFCSNVSDDGRFAVTNPATDGVLSKSRLNGGRLFVTFRVIGSASAIAYLKKWETLDVKVTLYGNGRKIRDYNIGISQENWNRNGKALVSEFEETGLFNWRTKFYTDQTGFSSISMKIQDPNGDFVTSLDSAGSYEPALKLID